MTTSLPGPGDLADHNPRHAEEERRQGIEDDVLERVTLQPERYDSIVTEAVRLWVEQASDAELSEVLDDE